MADLIDAKDAQRLLGCDEATLEGHVDRGVIRGEMAGGKLRVNKDDVVKLHDAQGEQLKLDDEEDGTIVLTGESDNLTIDLGSVDTNETLAFKTDEKATGKGKIDTQTLSFGDELEVLSFEDPKPTEKAAKPATTDTKPTSQFTDQNTAVMTAVDDAIGTGPVSYNTGLDAAATMVAGSNESSRRSVRSNRVRIESAPVSPLWIGVMALNAAVLLLLVAPYAVLSGWPNEGKDAAGNTLRGVDDGFWSGIAATAAGFSIEPSKERFATTHGQDKEWTDIKTTDGQADWRIAKYRGEFKKPGERLSTFIIEKVSEDGKKAIAAGGKKEYSIVEVKSGQAGAEITEEKVDLGFDAK